MRMLCFEISLASCFKTWQPFCYRFDSMLMAALAMRSRRKEKHELRLQVSVPLISPFDVFVRWQSQQGTSQAIYPRRKHLPIAHTCSSRIQLHNFGALPPCVWEIACPGCPIDLERSSASDSLHSRPTQNIQTLKHPPLWFSHRTPISKSAMTDA
jgi:hypothetical protein